MGARKHELVAARQASCASVARISPARELKLGDAGRNIVAKGLASRAHRLPRPHSRLAWEREERGHVEGHGVERRDTYFGIRKQSYTQPQTFVNPKRIAEPR
jgi:hypothetical protein